MQIKNSNNAKNILERVKIFLNLRIDTELAEYLGIAQNTLSGWKTRNSIDYDLIIDKLKDKNINLNWLLTGTGTMKLDKRCIENIPNLDIVEDNTAIYRSKINELEVELKKNDVEINKDHKEIARLELEIAELRAKLDYADNIINKLIKSS